MSDINKASTVDYEEVSADYLENRQLKKGVAGWILLASLVTDRRRWLYQLYYLSDHI